VRPRRAWFSHALLLVSLAVHLVAVVALRGNHVPDMLDADEHEYWSLASSLLAGDWDEVLPRRTFPFPMLLAGLRLVWGPGYLGTQLLLSAIFSLLPWLTYHLVRRELGVEVTARIAGVLTLIWPLFLKYGATTYSDPTGLVVLVAFLLALPGPGEVASRARRCFLAGLVLALCIHVKPLYLLYAPLAAMVVLLREPSFGARLQGVSLLTAGCLSLLLPYAVFLSAREHRLLLISGNDGETLAGGLNPNLLGHDEAMTTPEGRITWVGPGKWLPPDETGFLSADEQRLPYSEKGRLLSERVRTWIADHPGDAAYLTARKLLYMWGIYPFWQGPGQTLFGNVPILLALLASGFALWRLRHRLASLAMFWSLPILSSLVACISWGSWRFRMPGDLGLLVLVACACSSRALRAPPSHLA